MPLVSLRLHSKFSISSLSTDNEHCIFIPLSYSLNKLVLKYFSPLSGNITTITPESIFFAISTAATIAALVTQSKAKILSSPKVVTINGKEAKALCQAAKNLAESNTKAGVVYDDGQIKDIIPEWPKAYGFAFDLNKTEEFSIKVPVEYIEIAGDDIVKVNKE